MKRWPMANSEHYINTLTCLFPMVNFPMVNFTCLCGFKLSWPNGLQMVPREKKKKKLSATWSGHSSGQAILHLLPNKLQIV